MCVEELLCIVVTGEDVQAVPVDLHIATDCEVSWGDELHVLVNVLVFAALKELPFEDP